MAYTSRSLKQSLADTQQLLADAERLLTAMRAEQARFEERTEALTTQLYQARVLQRETELAHEQVLEQLALLRERLGLKQAAIEVLLSAYPQPQREQLRQLLAA